MLLRLAQHAFSHCLRTPPPEGTSDTDALDRGIREVLHATGTQMASTLGSGWSMRSLDEITQAWQAE